MRGKRLRLSRIERLPPGREDVFNEPLIDLDLRGIFLSVAAADLGDRLDGPRAGLIEGDFSIGVDAGHDDFAGQGRTRLVRSAARRRWQQRQESACRALPFGAPRPQPVCVEGRDMKPRTSLASPSRVALPRWNGPTMTAIQVPGLLTLTIAIVVFFAGAGLNRLVPPLHRWNIPEAV